MGSECFEWSVIPGQRARTQAVTIVVIQGTARSGVELFDQLHWGIYLTINPAELASSAITYVQEAYANLVYNGLAKDFSGEINISGSAQTEIIQL